MFCGRRKKKKKKKKKFVWRRARGVDELERSGASVGLSGTK